MIKHDVIDEHRGNEQASWVFNAVLAPKVDGPIRITLDARNASKQGNLMNKQNNS